MPDVLAWRKKFGVLAPSTNTIVEPDLHMMEVPGVTSHMGRIMMQNTVRHSANVPDNDQRAIRLGNEMQPTIERLLTMEPDYLVMAMSAPTFRGGLEGNLRWKAQMQEYSGGLGMANGAEACQRALNLLNVKRISVLTPYWSDTSDHVIQYFTESGFEVVANIDLESPSAVGIGHITSDKCQEALLKINSDKVEAIIQCGTNLNMIRLADEADRWLGKPVLAINATIWWMALRDNGITDQLQGFGRMLRDY